uniref:Uncharacterized protein n=1 Tax=Myoviridae sp. ctCo31 TaxID=2825053 RepID=A0A8S5UM57_9CAUD|nr:MAG TPA: hypothetical protein [Myoviridae sp. ctCo31]
MVLMIMMFRIHLLVSNKVVFGMILVSIFVLYKIVLVIIHQSSLLNL